MYIGQCPSPHFGYSNTKFQRKAKPTQLVCSTYGAQLRRFIFNLMFGGLEVACWPLVSKFAGSNLAEAIGFLRGKKILSTPSFGGEVKPSVPCHRFAACKRSLKCNVEVDILGKNYLLGVSWVARTRRRTGGESGNI